MKGYQVEDRLYIFPQTVDVIPEVEGVDVIYVQHETVKAWKEANDDVADKIKGYNFLTITALPKEWAGHTDDDIEPEPEPVVTTYYADFYNSLEDETPTDYGQITNDGTVARTETIDGQEIDLTACLITASEYPEIIGRTVYGNIDDMQYIGTDTKVPTYVEYEGAVVNYGYAIISREPIPHPEPTYTLDLDGTYSEGGGLYVTIDDEPINEFPCDVTEGATVKFVPTVGDVANYEWDQQLSVDGDGNYYIVMPAESVTITINYNGAQAQTYTLTLTGDDILTYTDVKINDETVENTGEWEVYENDDIKIEYRSTTGTYNIVQAPTGAQPIPDGNGGLEFTMPAEDTTVTIDFVDGGSSSSGAGE